MNLKQTLIEKIQKTKRYLRYFFRWIILGGIMGVVGGAIGAAFSHSLAGVTEIREKMPWLIFFLPAAGLVIVLIYRVCRIHKAGTNAVFETVRDERTVPVMLAPAVFVTTALTHLFGGSAGREGAALQMGGSLAALIGKIFRLKEKRLHILTMCGMAALFSAVFGTPVGACIFAVEVASVGRLYTAAMLPCIVSSSVAYGTALLLGVVPEAYNVGVVPDFSFLLFGKTVLIGMFIALAGMLFCSAMKGGHILFKRLFHNQFLRAAVGGTAIILLTLILGTDEYSGSGAHIIEGIFEGEHIVPYAFLLKIIFTSITMGSGYKGGEIVPTLFIGATLGGTLAGGLMMSVPFGAAIGMVSLFAGVTNCPITAAVLAVELFGADGAVFYMVAILASYILSGNFSLYSGQKIIYSRLDDKQLTPNGR